MFVLLTNMKQKNNFSIYIDGKKATITQEELLTKIANTTYVNIEKFAKLVGYEYHEGEYKSYITEKDKCYVEGKNETASFYLNDNKVYKLPLNEREKEYEEYAVVNAIKSINEKKYAPIDAISRAFNVFLEETDRNFNIYTLNYLIAAYDTNVKKWGYESIANQSFENNKALLYGYLIVKKEGRII